MTTPLRRWLPLVAALVLTLGGACTWWWFRSSTPSIVQPLSIVLHLGISE